MSFYDDMDLSLLLELTLEKKVIKYHKEVPMKPYYWIMIPVALVAVGALYALSGKIAAVIGAGLWISGWATMKHRQYVVEGVGQARTSFIEKLRVWIRS